MVNKRRTYRVAEKIRNLIATELNGLADPRFELVTITSVVTSPDLQNAKVYWMATGGREREEQVTAAFKSAEGHFRRLLAKDLGTRFTPSMKFYYDDTLDTVQEVTDLLSKIESNTSHSENPDKESKKGLYQEEES